MENFLPMASCQSLDVHFPSLPRMREEIWGLIHTSASSLASAPMETMAIDYVTLIKDKLFEVQMLYSTSQQC